MDVTLLIMPRTPRREGFDKILAGSARALITITASFLMRPALIASRIVLFAFKAELTSAVMGAAYGEEMVSSKP